MKLQLTYLMSGHGWTVMIVSDNTVDARTTVIEIIVCKHDQDCIFSLLALDKHCVSAEEL
jgi:hypothetical protein